MRLREELFLLGHDTAGRPVVHPDSLDVGVAGARLVELALARKIGVSGGRLAVTDATATGDPDTDTLLAAILRAPAPPPVGGSLTHLRPGAGDQVRDTLLAEGAVKKVAQRRLGLMPVTRYPADEALVRSISVRLWYAAHGKAQPDDVTGSLCGLVHAVLLHEHVFVNMPMAGLGARLQAIRDGLPAAVRDLVDGVGTLVATHAVAIYR